MKHLNELDLVLLYILSDIFLLFIVLSFELIKRVEFYSMLSLFNLSVSQYWLWNTTPFHPL